MDDRREEQEEAITFKLVAEADADGVIMEWLLFCSSVEWLADGFISLVGVVGPLSSINKTKGGVEWGPF